MRPQLGSVFLAMMLAACAARAPIPAPETSSAPSGAAMGVVESASVLSLPSSGPAAGGGTAAKPATGATMAYRVQMADGSTRSVVQAGERFAVGDRVAVTSDGRLARP